MLLLLLLAMASSRRSPSSPRSSSSRNLASSTSSAPSSSSSARRRWVWPLPRLNGRKPKISSGWGSPRKGHTHAGADVMYSRSGKKLAWPRKGPLPDHGSPGHVLPEGTAVLAASDGVVWSTGRTKRGRSVTISHPGTGLATFYQHLARLDIPAHKRGKRTDGGPPTQVTAGQPIGTAGYSELDGRQIRHLHFEIREGVKPFDPEPTMKGWEVV